MPADGAGVRPLLTVLEKNGKSFVSAEIPGIDLAERPCYYKGTGRIKGVLYSDW